MLKLLTEAAYNGICLVAENGETEAFDPTGIDAPKNGSFQVRTSAGNFIVSITETKTEKQTIASNLREASDRIAEVLDRENPKLRGRDYDFIMARFDAISGALVS